MDSLLPRPGNEPDPNIMHHGMARVISFLDSLCNPGPGLRTRFTPFPSSNLSVYVLSDFPLHTSHVPRSQHEPFPCFVAGLYCTPISPATTGM